MSETILGVSNINPTAPKPLANPLNPFIVPKGSVYLAFALAGTQPYPLLHLA